MAVMISATARPNVTNLFINSPSKLPAQAAWPVKPVNPGDYIG
jgi:hypothetical protein